MLEDVNMVSISREQQIRAASIWPCSQTSYYCEHKWFSCLVACTSLVQVQVFSYCELGKPLAQNTCCRHSKSCLLSLLRQKPFALSPRHLITPVRERWLELMHQVAVCYSKHWSVNWGAIFTGTSRNKILRLSPLRPSTGWLDAHCKFMDTYLADSILWWTKSP